MAAVQSWDFAAPAEAVDAAFWRSGCPPDLRSRRGLIAALALKLPDIVSELRLPASVLDLYPRSFDTLVSSLQSDVSDYDPDFYAKDLRFVLGLSVPAGAQIVDLHARLGPKLILRQLHRPEGLRVLRSYVAAGGHGCWLQIHTDTRDTADFNEEGWDACYLRVADLLRCHPAAVGMLGTSWFYDPALVAISPRLAYLQKPVDEGAFRARIGPSALDAERAGTKSSTRKALIESGEYVPAAFSLAWPRAALIRWADRQGAAAAPLAMAAG